MKQSKKVLAVLSAAAIAASMSVPAFAAEKAPNVIVKPIVELDDRVATTAIRFDFETNRNSISTNLKINRGYVYWKVAVTNNGTSDVYFTIAPDTGGAAVYTSINIQPGESLSFHSSDPMAEGNYLLTVHSADTSKGMKGMLYHKTGQTLADVVD